MEIRIKQYWFNIKNSLWFLPTMMAISATILAFGFIELDSRINYDDFPIAWFLYGGQRDGARSVLSTIASSMVTIAGVTFSITLVALTMASSQFGPRLLRNFISDKGNQFVIGTFISTFIYSLIVLLTIRGSGDDEMFVPKISIVFAFLLAVQSLGVLIYFIHHVATSIQADYIIKTSYNDFQKLITHALLDENKQVESANIPEQVKKVKTDYPFSTEIYFDSSGYVQSIDYEGACSWAEKNEAVIEWLVYPGLFATIFQAFAVVHHHSPQNHKPDQQIRKFLFTAYQRTPNQDLVFSLRQIVEVGVRALSPGTNDPYTAITCIHWIGAALSELSKKKLNNPFLYDKEENIRVILNQITYQEIVDTCFNQFQLYGKSNLFVTLEMLAAIKKPLYIGANSELLNVLRTKATGIFQEAREGVSELQLKQLEESYREIMQLGE